jgi:hypothetical protein
MLSCQTVNQHNFETQNSLSRSKLHACPIFDVVAWFDAAEVINACHIYTNIPAKGEAIALAVIRQKCLRFGNLWYASQGTYVTSPQ